MMTMMSCSSVWNVGRPYCGQTVAYFSYCSAELLFIDYGSAYVGQFWPLLLLPHWHKTEEATALSICFIGL